MLEQAIEKLTVEVQKLREVIRPFRRPFSMKAALRLLPDSDLIEYARTENEKDRSHSK